jgi:hypothetical protein
LEGDVRGRRCCSLRVVSLTLHATGFQLRLFPYR